MFKKRARHSRPLRACDIECSLVLVVQRAELEAPIRRALAPRVRVVPEGPDRQHVCPDSMVVDAFADVKIAKARPHNPQFGNTILQLADRNQARRDYDCAQGASTFYAWSIYKS